MIRVRTLAACSTYFDALLHHGGVKNVKKNVSGVNGSSSRQ
jgi:hypothetical protein